MGYPLEQDGSRESQDPLIGLARLIARNSPMADDHDLDLDFEKYERVEDFIGMYVPQPEDMFYRREYVVFPEEWEPDTDHRVFMRRVLGRPR